MADRKRIGIGNRKPGGILTAAKNRDVPEKYIVRPEELDALYLREKLPRHTLKQFEFVMSYIQYSDPLRAYNDAGYASLESIEALYRRNYKVQRVLDSDGVQALMTAIQDQIIERRGLKVDHLVEQLLRAHSRAKSATEEIMAIREIGRLLGYYDKAERKQRVDKLNKKGITNLSDFELKRLSKPGPTLNPNGTVKSQTR